MGDQRHWLLRFSAELVVVVLLATAAVTYQFDVGKKWLGSPPTDPTANPSAVPPPEGLRLPATRAVPAVAATGRAVALDQDEVAAAVAPLLRKNVLGKHFGVLVTDLATGRPVFRRGARSVIPASTAKLVTSMAALQTLGPMARFRTTVRWIPRKRQLVLVGGGDPFLASSPGAPGGSYPARADVATLARAAVRRLHAMRITRVRLAFDDSYFTGPAVNPAWPNSYISEGVVPPISALWVDEGRSPSGLSFLNDPAAAAADAFGAALRRSGLRVADRKVPRVRVSPGVAEVAAVSSAPLGEIVERTLVVSDNQAAEVLARHVGLAESQEGSSLAGAAAVLDVARRLGVPLSGTRLYDGSGLARSNRLATDTLAAVLRLSVSPDHPQLRRVFTGLPVAGFTGSLQYRFDKGPDQARGRVRAKTGTLTGVHGLAGVADDVGGGRMAFVVVADRVKPLKNLEAQVLIDRIAAALGACTCGVGSVS